MPDGWLGPVPDEADDRGFSSLKTMKTTQTFKSRSGKKRLFTPIAGAALISDAFADVCSLLDKWHGSVRLLEQRLTTNRPIESAPDKPCSLIPTLSAGALPIGA